MWAIVRHLQLFATFESNKLYNIINNHFQRNRSEMTDEELVEQILSVNNGISREGLLERLEGEKRKTGGLISNETLLRMIAAEFGLNLSQAETRTPTLSISDLISGLYDVTIVGRVVAVFPPRAFNGKKSGKLASLLIADKTGILRVVLWNHQISLVESGEISVGRVVHFFHAYTKDDRSGKVELHVGSKSKVEICSGDAESDCPTIDQFCTKIGDISQGHKNRRVNVSGKVRNVSPVSIFERQDLSAGKVMRFALTDETGEISVVAWNEKADELEKALKQGVSLQMVNGRVKETLSKGLEVHVDGGTYVKISLTERFLKVAELRQDLNDVNLVGEVTTRPVTREVQTSKGEIVKVASFELKDETGKTWVAAWRKHAELACNLRSGQKIIIRNAYMRKGFGEQVEVSTKDTTSITPAC